jgi:type II secretion system protein G
VSPQHVVVFCTGFNHEAKFDNITSFDVVDMKGVRFVVLADAKSHRDYFAADKVIWVHSEPMEKSSSDGDKDSYGAKVARVRADFDALGKACKLYKLDMARYPEKIDELWQAPAGAKNWKGPYIEDAPPAPRDPWGNPYVYTPPKGSTPLGLMSYGSDGAPGGVGEAQDLTTENISDIEDGK